MKELVFMKGNQPVTTSLIIADGTGNEHRSIIRLIQNYQPQFERWGKVRFSDVDLKSATNVINGTQDNNHRLSNDLRGRPTKVAYLNEQQATFLITLLRNNDIVLEFKSELVDRFYKMREALLNRQNAQWQEIRGGVKVGYKELSAAVKELYEWAVSHGCKAPEKAFYANFARLMNKTLGISSKSRDTLAAWQLFEIEKLQFIARTIIAGLLAQGADYHLPYRDCKSAFESYARLSFINQRLLQEV